MNKYVLLSVWLTLLHYLMGEKSLMLAQKASALSGATARSANQSGRIRVMWSQLVNAYNMAIENALFI